MNPRFTVGQQVEFFPDITQDRSAGGLFEIIKQMPFESDGHKYRIRNAAGVERIATERQLELASG